MTDSPTATSPPTAPRRRRWLPVMAMLIAAAATAAMLLVARHVRRAPPPPELGAVPEFTLTEQSGREIRRADLDGTPWVADFIFTRCTGMCPALTSRMVDVRSRIADAGLRARAVSFSVDPTHDTPAVLRAYARRHGADDDDWLFVTGPRDALYALIGDGFRLSVSERGPDAVAAQGGELIAHSDRFVLVDGRGRIRGYYHGLDAGMPEALLRDLAALGNEG